MTLLAKKPHTSYRTFKSVKFETPSNSHDPQLPLSRNEPESYVMCTHTETSYDVQDIKYDQHLQLTPRKLHHHRELPLIPKHYIYLITQHHHLIIIPSSHTQIL